MGKTVLFIGDIHGRTDWEKMISHALPKFWHIVFVGDYVDSFNIRPVEILHNLKKIIGYKKKYPDRITLLLGNHDYAYIDNHDQTSGYDHHVAFDYKQIFQENYDLFQVAWAYYNEVTQKYTLATHAGITLTYYNNYIKPLIEDPTSIVNKVRSNNDEYPALHEVLNLMRNEEILWKVGYDRGGMGTPGPLWADYNELIADPYPGINQVFGHSAVGTVTVNQINNDLIVKVDGSIMKSTANIILNL